MVFIPLIPSSQIHPEQIVLGFAQESQVQYSDSVHTNPPRVADLAIARPTRYPLENPGVQQPSCPWGSGLSLHLQEPFRTTCRGAQ